MKRLYGLIGLGGLFALLFLAPLDASACAADCGGTAPECHQWTIQNCTCVLVEIGGTCDDGVPGTIGKCEAGDCIEHCADADEDGSCDATEDICPPPAHDDVGCEIGGEWFCRDDDNDGVCNAVDLCPGEDDTIDTDGDSVPDCADRCEGFSDLEDLDNDGTPDGCDNCPNDNAKTEPGVCGCGVVESPTCSCESAPTWIDVNSGLMWEAVARLTTYSNPFIPDDPSTALNYCANLVLDGYDNWRLPTIDDLRTLILGCPQTAPGGSCQVTDPSCLDSGNPGCTVGCLDSTVCEYEPGRLYVPECYDDLNSTITMSSSKDDADPSRHWALRHETGLLATYHGGISSAWRCVRCDDTDGDGVCDADDVCPGGDDNIDYLGEGEQNVNGASLPNGIPDYCDCLTFDAVGTTLYPTPPETWSAANFETDGRVTFGAQNMWEDDTLGCYEAFKTPAFLFYFPRCDHNENGLVDLQELFDIYHFAMAAGGSTDCSAFK